MALDKEKKILKTFSLELHPHSPSKYIIVEDSIEGDMYFNYYITHISDHDKSCTDVSIEDRFHARINFSVAPYKYATSYSPIRLGTYQTQYELFMEYSIKPMNKSGVHEVTITFLISNK